MDTHLSGERETRSSSHLLLVSRSVPPVHLLTPRARQARGAVRLLPGGQDLSGHSSVCWVRRDQVLTQKQQAPHLRGLLVNCVNSGVLRHEVDGDCFAIFGVASGGTDCRIDHSHTRASQRQSHCRTQTCEIEVAATPELGASRSD